ncbi:CLC_0170 family protein [Anaerosalibacter sp. Marseille-P3206]|uniref:CLC_0170 family protein n=1 Tax=Anaerosalibacter sp. Marseille-P3206 TaxID=1871005 RepID=UPI00350F3E0F
MEILFLRVLSIIKGFFSYYLVFIMLIVSLFTLVVDIPKLKKGNFNREANIAKAISIIYIILGPIIYILLKKI